MNLDKLLITILALTVMVVLVCAALLGLNMMAQQEDLDRIEREVHEVHLKIKNNMNGDL